jgi:hypothetical protein
MSGNSGKELGEAVMDEAHRWAEEQWSVCDLSDQRRTRRAVEVSG